MPIYRELIILCAKYLIILPVIVGIVYVLMLPKGRRLLAIVVLCISAPVAYIVALLSGWVYYDPRPFVANHITPLIAHAPDNGFPSDHALLASVIAFVIFYFNKPLGAALFVVALIIGAARVLAGVHHTVDIAGAVIIAGIVVSAVYYSVRAVTSR